MMKLLHEMTDGQTKNERYDLNDAFSESDSNKGLVICYALAVSPFSELVSLDANAQFPEIGVAEEWHARYTKESFERIFSRGLSAFLEAFDVDDFGSWTAVVNYRGTDITVSGRREKTLIFASYPEGEINPIPLFGEVETATYKFAADDAGILGIMKERFGMSDKRAVLAFKKLSAHPDICAEFVETVKTGGFPHKEDAVAVEGFTAEKLNAGYPLSVIGAYNYLIYLREATNQAIEDLEKGLPRK